MREVIKRDFKENQRTYGTPQVQTDQSCWKNEQLHNRSDRRFQLWERKDT